MTAIVLRIASLSLFFLLSVFASAPVVAAADGSIEAPSRVSAFVHDLTTWLNRAVGNAGNHYRADRHPPPLPRPRPAELAAPSLVTNKQSSEVVPPPVAPKKNTPAVVQIND